MTSTLVESGPFSSIYLKSAELPGSPLSKRANCRRENRGKFAEASMIIGSFVRPLTLGIRSNKGITFRYSEQVDKSTPYQYEGRTNNISIDTPYRFPESWQGIFNLRQGIFNFHSVPWFLARAVSQVTASVPPRPSGSSGFNDAVAPRRGAGNSRYLSVRCEGQLTIRTLRDIGPRWTLIDTPPVHSYPSITPKLRVDFKARQPAF
jgi:hypothetical protein